jgi:cysteine synthase
VFVGGTLLGGCTATLDAFKDGRLQLLLKQHGVAFDDSVHFDPHTLLPSWQHPTS